MRTLRISPSGGNMYDKAGTINLKRGRCPHACVYCYVEDMKGWALAMRTKYAGLPGLDEGIMEAKWVLMEGVHTVMVPACGDLAVLSDEDLLAVFKKCRKYPFPYLFQSKDPRRFSEFIDRIPPHTLLGSTIETDQYPDGQLVSLAPSPEERYRAMKRLCWPRKMLSIEPIMQFEPKRLVRWCREIKPEYISIGADSGGHNLPEPNSWAIYELISQLRKFTEVRLKKNLRRLASGISITQQRRR